MGSPARPISAVTQKLEKGVAAQSSVTGTATFTFPSPPPGVSWTGTLTCSGAPASAVFTASVGATSWGSWGGNSVFGPVQLFGQGSEVLTVTATGLLASTTYNLFLLGSSDGAVNVAPIWPDTTSSALTALATGSASTILATTGVTFTAGSVSVYSGILTQTFSGFVVIWGADTTASRTVSTKVSNGTTGQSHTVKTANTQTGIGAGTNGGSLAQNNVSYFPVTVAAGQSLVVSASSSQVGWVDSVQIIGLTSSNSIFVEQAPNTTAYTGNFGGQFVAGVGVIVSGGAAALLGNPPTGFAWRLHRLGLTPSGTGLGLNPSGALWLQDSTFYVAGMECSAPSGYSAQSIDLNGQIVTSGLSAFWLGAGNIAGAYVRYDIVPLTKTTANS